MIPGQEHDMANYPSVKHATRDNVKDILAMIHELAAYENETASVEATEESLARTLSFDPCGCHHTNPGFARTLILRLPASPSEAYKQKYPTDEPEAVAGMALYFTSYSTWRSKPGIYLEDLFVRPQYRRRGYGKLLIQDLARLTLAIDGGRLEWSCMTWNEPSLKFYRSLGAVEKKEWVGLRVDGDALHKLALGRARAIQKA